MYFNIMKVLQSITQLVEQVQDVEYQTSQRIADSINSLIQNINKELLPFCLSISRPFQSIMHSFAVILLTKAHFDVQRKYLQHTLNELETKQKSLENRAVGVVADNASIDDKNAVSFCQQLKERLVGLLTNDGENFRKEKLADLECLNRTSIQKFCDEKLFDGSDASWCLNYIENPIKVIQQTFDNKWQNIPREIDAEFKRRKLAYGKMLEGVFARAKGLLDVVERPNMNIELVHDIFTVSEKNSFDAQEDLINKKHCMMTLLEQYLTKNNIPETYSSNGKNYRLKQKVFVSLQSLLQRRTHTVELLNIGQQFSSIFNGISISDLNIFLRTLLKEEDNVLKYFNDTRCNSSSVLSRETYENLLKKILGCTVLCPCCKRPCDIDHSDIKSSPGSKYNEHRCTSGHGLRAFNGYKFQITEEPSLLTCEQIKDNDEIIISQEQYSWLNFKRKHYDWLFDSTLDAAELSRLRNKYFNVWKEIGDMLCRKFSMKYLTCNNSRKYAHEAFHFILVLDASRSMVGDPWDCLRRVVQEFFQCRQRSSTETRVTVIVFSNEAEILMRDQAIQHFDPEKISYRGDKVSFDSAFRAVNRCLTELNQNNPARPLRDKNAIVFISNGNGVCPEDALKQLVDAHCAVIKQFWTVALVSNESSQRRVLKEINERMEGSFCDISAFLNFFRVYPEVASNTNF